MAKVSPDRPSGVAQEVATLEAPPRTERSTRDRIRERLAELGRLEDGWMNGEGIALSRAALEAVERALESELSAVAESAGIFPTLEGGIQLEWFLGEQYHLAVEVFFDGKTAEASLVDVRTADGPTIELDTANVADWKKVTDLIESHS